MARFDPTRCPTALVAACTGLSAETVRQRHKAGVYTQTARGKYDLFAVLAAERAYIQASARAPVVPIETARLRRAQAEGAEQRNEARASEVVSAGEVAYVLALIQAELASLDAFITPQLCRDVAAASEPAVARRLIHDAQREARARVADRLQAMIPDLPRTRSPQARYGRSAGLHCPGAGTGRPGGAGAAVGAIRAVLDGRHRPGVGSASP